jgi:hypothetical protein
MNWLSDWIRSMNAPSRRAPEITEDWCVPMRYQIFDDEPDCSEEGVLTMHSFRATRACATGRRAFYFNTFVEEGELSKYGPYREKTDTAAQYKEGVPVFGTDGFYANVNRQSDRILRLGGRGAPLDVDNRDAYLDEQMAELYSYLAARGHKIIVKNPGVSDFEEDSFRLLRHPAVIGTLSERGKFLPSDVQRMLRVARRTGLMKWFVSWNDRRGGQQFAERCREDIVANKVTLAGVTYSPSRDEYSGDVVDVFKPVRSF